MTPIEDPVVARRRGLAQRAWGAPLNTSSEWTVLVDSQVPPKYMPGSFVVIGTPCDVRCTNLGVYQARTPCAVRALRLVVSFLTRHTALSLVHRSLRHMTNTSSFASSQENRTRSGPSSFSASAAFHPCYVGAR